jgi:hypothetical protein
MAERLIWRAAVVERVVLNALLKVNAALPPDFFVRAVLWEQDLAPPRNDGAIDFGIVFGEADPPQCARANGSITQGQCSIFVHKPAATGFCRM